jgi:Holliday junction resolvase RusA-like endonuclease
MVRTRTGKEFITTYTAAATQNYEKLIAQIAALHMRGKQPEALPVAIEIDAYFPVPQSWSQKKAEQALAGIVLPNVKPDWDNISKSVCDSLKRIVWEDDKQVVMGRVRKMYAERPRLEVAVWRVS